MKEIKFYPLLISNRNIGNQYIFAYVKDYFDDLGIDSVEAMRNIQISAYKKCNKNGFEKKPFFMPKNCSLKCRFFF